MTVDEVDVENQRRALDCYVTYQETIEAAFEIYQEVYDPPLESLFDGLTRN
jgi:hypothetical protein